MSIKKQPTDFKGRTKVAIISNVDPQNRTVDISYTSQAGNYVGLTLPYSAVGATWGMIYMPVKGDRVLIDNIDGSVPVIKSMHPQNTDYLPYLDPGEVATMSENGSYMHWRNRRKRIKSTGELIDYDATKGPNGETDIEYEPGGLVLRARSKKLQDNAAPRWYSHSYFSMFDNGDVSIQSMKDGRAKGLLYFEGTSGYTWWHAGDGKVQEYIELNPVKKEIVMFSDGDIHQHVQKDIKKTAYVDDITNIGGALQVKIGVDPTTINVDFDKVLLDSDLLPGDVRFDNSTAKATGGNWYEHIKNNISILSDAGNYDLALTTGNMTVEALAGTATITAETVSLIGVPAGHTVGSTQHVIDGINDKVSTILAAGHSHVLDSVLNAITTTITVSGGGNALKHVVNGVTQEISTIAPFIGLGAPVANLDATKAALNQSHLTTYEASSAIQRKIDMVTLTTTIGPWLTNGAAALAAVNALSALAHVGVPAGSGVVKVANNA